MNSEGKTLFTLLVILFVIVMVSFFRWLLAR